jgi:hypothetical protein
MGDGGEYVKGGEQFSVLSFLFSGAAGLFVGLLRCSFCTNPH